jgi:hypothetical protein
MAKQVTNAERVTCVVAKVVVLEEEAGIFEGCARIIQFHLT